MRSLIGHDAKQIIERLLLFIDIFLQGYCVIKLMIIRSIINECFFILIVHFDYSIN